MDSEALRALAEALEAIDGLAISDCDGQGHPVAEVEACLHVTCDLPSPTREEFLARLSSAVRMVRGFVMVALHGRKDMYSVSYRTPRRNGNASAAAEKLAVLLSDPQSLDSPPIAGR